MSNLLLKNLSWWKCYNFPGNVFQYLTILAFRKLFLHSNLYLLSYNLNLLGCFPFSELEDCCQDSHSILFAETSFIFYCRLYVFSCLIVPAAPRSFLCSSFSTSSYFSWLPTCPSKHKLKPWSLVKMKDTSHIFHATHFFIQSGMQSGFLHRSSIQLQNTRATLLPFFVSCSVPPVLLWPHKIHIPDMKYIVSWGSRSREDILSLQPTLFKLLCP